MKWNKTIFGLSLSISLLWFAFAQQSALVYASDRGVTDGGTVYNSAAERTAAELGDANWHADPGQALRDANNAATDSPAENPWTWTYSGDPSSPDFVGPPAPGGAWSASAWGGSELTKKTFKFNPNDIAPTTKKYTKGTWNIPDLLNTVAKFLLVVVSTGAVLFIVIGGFMMAISAGDSEKANRWKIIITYNIIAIIIAMLSYGIIQFVIWVIWV